MERLQILSRSRRPVTDKPPERMVVARFVRRAYRLPTHCTGITGRRAGARERRVSRSRKTDANLHCICLFTSFNIPFDFLKFASQ